LIEPTLTTINYPGIEMGEIAARNLIRYLKEEPSEPPQAETIVVRTELIIRQSSMRKNQGTNK